MDEGALTVDQFLKDYGIGRSTLYEEIAAKRLRARKVGRKTLIPRADAINWLNSLPAVELDRPAVPA